MEDWTKESWRGMSLAILVILLMYAGIYLTAFYLVSDEMVSKSLVVGNILFYTPFVLLLTGFIYGCFYGLSYRFLVAVFLLYFVTIFFFHEWILLYQIAYTLCALIGNTLGALLFSLRKKLKKILEK